MNFRFCLTSISEILNSKILADFEIFADFKFLAFQNLELKILANLRILAFQNPELKISADFKILPFLNPQFKILAFQSVDF